MRNLGVILLVVVAACASRRELGNGGGDAGSGTIPDAGGGNFPDAFGGTVYVYAHTSSTLYKVDPDTLAITMVGAFQWPASTGMDQMTDIAVDKNGAIIGVSFGAVYKVNALTAECTLLSTGLQGSFNGLSFVPADMLGLTGDDILVGTHNDDDIVNRIDPMTGTATQVGHMGSAFMSSGDLVAVAGFGTVQTTLGAPHDVLSRLAPQTFAAMPIGTSTGQNQIWGVAYWKGKVFGFTQTGQFLTIDPTTGVATVVQSGGPEWWGAGVTTIAPVIQ
ncbi:MAG: Peptidyl-prolyl cis-trans isomerase [Myxococcales bacterium]|nr:Peptidyl-prolyl cis-trans isomerase [Myxococcales bacterium]